MNRSQRGRSTVIVSVLAAMLVATAGVVSNDASGQVGPPAGTAGSTPPGPAAGTAGSLPAAAPAPPSAKVDAGEARPDAKAGKATTDALRRIADKNGMISRERFTRMMADRFDAADVDKKGTLSVEAVRRILKQP